MHLKQQRYRAAHLHFTACAFNRSHLCRTVLPGCSAYRSRGTLGRLVALRTERYRLREECSGAESCISASSAPPSALLVLRAKGILFGTRSVDCTDATQWHLLQAVHELFELTPLTGAALSFALARVQESRIVVIGRGLKSSSNSRAALSPIVPYRINSGSRPAGAGPGSDGLPVMPRLLKTL